MPNTRVESAGRFGHGHSFPVLRQLELTSTEWGATVTGSGAAALSGNSLSITTGATAASTAYYKLGGEGFITRTSRFDKLDWSRPLTFWIRFCLGSATAAGAARISIGKNNTDGVGNLARRGVLFQVSNLTCAAQVHDGSGLTVPTISFPALVATTVYDLTVDCSGTGQVDFYIDDRLVGTTTAGPSTITPNVDEDNFQFEVSNGADSAAMGISIAQWIYQSD